MVLANSGQVALVAPPAPAVDGQFLDGIPVPFQSGLNC
jgi:hypothetical protein